MSHRIPSGGYSFSYDADFNFLQESRVVDLENDDDLTSDWAAPMLLSVRPAPGAAGGLRWS
jgi:hypothetical protein